MRIVRIIFVSLILAFVGFDYALGQTLDSSVPRDLERKCLTRDSGEMWTLTHAYVSKEEADKVFAFFADFAFLRLLRIHDRTSNQNLNHIPPIRRKYQRSVDIANRLLSEVIERDDCNVGLLAGF